MMRPLLRGMTPSPEQMAVLASGQLSSWCGLSVRIERATGRLFRRVHLKNVYVGIERNSPTGAFLSARDVTLTLASGNVQDPSAWGGLLREVRLDRPVMFLSRNQGGKWNVAHVMEPRLDEQPSNVRMTFLLSRGTVYVYDFFEKDSESPPFKLIVESVNGKVNLKPNGAVHFNLSGRERSGKFRRVMVRGSWREAQQELDLTVSLKNAKIAAFPSELCDVWDEYFRLEDGTASLEANILMRGFVDSDPSVELDGIVNVNGTTMIIPEREIVFRNVSLRSQSRVQFRKGRVYGFETKVATIQPHSTLGDGYGLIKLRDDVLHWTIDARNASLDVLRKMVSLDEHLPFSISGGRATLDIKGEQAKGGTNLAGDIVLSGSELLHDWMHKPLSMSEVHVGLDLAWPAGGAILSGGEVNAEIHLEVPRKTLPHAEISWRALEGGRSSVYVRLTKAPASLWGEIRQEWTQVKVRGGSVNGEFTAYIIPGEAVSWKSVRAKLYANSLSIEDPLVVGRATHITGMVELMDGIINAPEVTFRWRNMPALLRGNLLIADDPSLDLVVESNRVDYEAVFELIRAAAAERGLMGLNAERTGSLKFQIRGPISRPLMVLEMLHPQLLVMHAELGQFTFSNIRLSAESVGDEALALLMHEGEAAWTIPEGLAAQILDRSGKASIKVRTPVRFRDVKAVIGEKIVIDCQASMARLNVGGVPIRDLQGRLRLDGHRFHAREVSAHLFDGEIRAGVLRGEVGSSAALAWEGTATGMDATEVFKLGGLHPKDWSLVGRLSGRFKGNLNSERVAATGDCLLTHSELKGRTSIGTTTIALPKTRAEFTLAARSIDDHWKLEEALGRFRTETVEARWGSQVAGEGIEPHDRVVRLPTCLASIDYDGSRLRLFDMRADLWGGVWKARASCDPRTGKLEGEAGFLGIDLKEVDRCFDTPIDDGRMDVHLMLSGMLRRPVVDGEFFATGVRVHDVHFPYTRVRTRWERDRLEIPEIVARSQSMMVEGSGAISDIDYQLVDGEIDFQVGVTQIDLAALSNALKAGIFVDGLAKGNLRVHGRSRSVGCDATFDVLLPQVGNLLFESAAVDVSFAQDALNLHGLTAQVGSGELEIVGTVNNWCGEKRLHLQVGGTGLDFRRILYNIAGEVPLTGTLLNVEGEVRGTASAPTGSATLSARNVSLGEVPLGEVELSGHYGSSLLTLTSLQVKSSEGRVSLDGRAVLGGEGEWDAEFGLEDVKLVWLERMSTQFAELATGEGASPLWLNAGSILQRLPRPLSGMVTATVGGHGGSGSPWLSVRFVAKELTVGGVRGYHLEGDLGWDGKSVACKQLALRFGGGEVLCQGTIGKDGYVSLALVGSEMPAVAAQPWFDDDLPVTGVAEFDAQVVGDWRMPKVDGRVTVRELRYREWIVDRITIERFRLDNSVLRLSRGDGVLHFNDKQADVWGDIPLSYGFDAGGLRPVSLHVSAEEVPLSVVFGELFPFQEEEGRLRVDLELTGTWKHPRIGGSLLMTAKKIQLGQKAENYSDVELLVEMDDGRVALKKVRAKWRGGEVSAAGEIILQTGGLRNPLANLFDIAFNVRNVDAKLGRMLPLKSLGLTGRLSTQPDGVQRFEFSQIRAGNDRGYASGGGMIELNRGSFSEWRSFLPDQFPQHLAASHFDVALDLVKYPVRMPRRFSGKLTGVLRLKDGESGDVPVLEGALTFDDGVLVAFPKSSGSDGQGVYPSVMEFDLKLKTRKDLELMHGLFRAQVSGEVLVTGNSARPRVSGKFHGDRGIIRFPSGVVAKLEFADVSIGLRSEGPNGLAQPFVIMDARAKARVKDHSVFIEVRGPIEVGDQRNSRGVNMVLTAVPPLPEAEIAQRLFGISGKVLSSAIGSGGTASTAQAQVGAAVVSALLAGPEAALSRALNVDEFVFEHAGPGDGYNLRIGHEVAPDLYFIWRQGLGESISGWEVQYYLSRRTLLSWRAQERERREIQLQTSIGFD